MVLSGTGQRWGAGSGSSRTTGGVGCGFGNGDAGFGGEFVRGALPGQHLFEHLPAYFAPFLFTGRFGDEALLLAFKGGLLHP